MTFLEKLAHLESLVDRISTKLFEKMAEEENFLASVKSLEEKLDALAEKLDPTPIHEIQEPTDHAEDQPLEMP